MALLKEGAGAPDFSLPSTLGRNVSLADFRGHHLALVFYPADWSPVCGEELALYNEVLPLLKARQAEVLGISVDAIYSHKAYQKQHNLHFTLASDFEPKGAVARKYGAYRGQDGFCERALYLIDKQGIVRWDYLSPLDQNPGADGMLQALRSLQVEEAA